ncbi:MAG: ankyrin repeat domain-containing protein [Cyclobacteriaceae bacterium]
MKTSKTQLFSGLSMGLLTAVIVIMTSCEAKSQQKTKVEAPAMDFHTAAMTGNVDAVKQHIAAGSDLSAKDPFGGSSPLISAIVFDKTEAAKVLIDAGSDLKFKNNDGSTPLHVATFFCRTEIVKMLLAKGADKTLKNNYGSTPIEIVIAPWDVMKPIYEMQQASLGGFGLELDLGRIEKTRPAIADLLK